MKRYLTKAQVDGMIYDNIKERVYWGLKHWCEVEIYQANGLDQYANNKKEGANHETSNLPGARAVP